MNKVYDGTTAAIVTLFDDRVSGDSLSVTNSTADFSDKNVGTGKTVTVLGIAISGTDAGNYTFNTTATHHGEHHGQGADRQAPPASNKVYDGNTSATP